MVSKPASSNQLSLCFRATAGLPFAVAPKRIGRSLRRACAENWHERGYLETVALLREVRISYRRTLRDWRRAGQRGSAAAFACTPEGRRAHRVIEALSERIAAEQMKLGT